MGYYSFFVLEVPDSFPVTPNLSPEEEDLRKTAEAMGFEIARKSKGDLRGQNWAFDPKTRVLTLQDYEFLNDSDHPKNLFFSSDRYKFYESDTVLEELSVTFPGVFKLEWIGEDGARGVTYARYGVLSKGDAVISFPGPSWGTPGDLVKPIL